MPTIEIASINSTGLRLSQLDFDIAIIEEDKLESHRGLFYDFLKNQQGTIVHIGNPEFRNDKDSGFFAGKIIDWNADLGEIENPEFDPAYEMSSKGDNKGFKFQFLNQYKLEIDRILKEGLLSSPINKIYFLTDYQCGLKGRIEKFQFTIQDFWARHNSEGLVFNTLYELHNS